MNKAIKIILITAVAVLGIGFLPCFVSANGLINITFEQKPLFQETNFLPGQSATHWIEVENKSSETQPIGIEVINYSSCSSNCFSDRLNLTISQNSTELYEDSLTDFFGAGQIKLSDLAAGGTTKYFFSVAFLPGSGNEYQEKETSFDFTIGTLGKESIGSETPPGGSGGGGGGFFVSGLEIFNEVVSGLGESEATIAWNTNISATSRVIYSSEHQPRTLQLDNPPNYGYFSSTAENSALTTDHQMVVSGLTPGTTYYFRCVSRGSLAVSKELKFTTTGVAGEAIEILPIAQPSDYMGQFPVSDPGGRALGEEIELPEEVEEVIEEDILEETVLAEEMVEDVFGFGILCWILFILIFILLVLSLLSALFKKGKKPASILSLFTAILLILYFIFCCRTCWILILVAAILFVLSLILSRKKKEISQNSSL